MIQEQEKMLHKIDDIASELIRTIVQFTSANFEDAESEKKALYGLIDSMKYKRDDLDNAISWFAELTSAINNCRVICNK